MTEQRIQILNRETVQWQLPHLHSDSLLEDLAEIPGVTYYDPAPGEPTATLRVSRNALPVLERMGLVPERPSFKHHVPQTEPVATARVLFKHQREAVARATSRGALLLADTMGLGKTTSGAVSAQAMRLPGRPVLISAPGYYEAIWRYELAALGFIPQKRAEQDDLFFACRGADPSKYPMHRGIEWIFCHYDILRYWWQTLQLCRVSSVIFDEAHMVKNPKSQRGKAAALVTPGTAGRIVLTGTPVQNNMQEAHALLTLTTGPGTWGSEFDFRKRYGGAHATDYGWKDGAPTNVDELQMRLDDVYLRRDTSVLEEKLPERTRRRIDVTLPEATQRQVANLLEGYSPQDILTAIRRSAAGTETLKWLMRLRKATSVGKEKATLEIVSSILEQGDSVLVFCWMRESVNQFQSNWIEAGHRAIAVEGAMSQAQRDEAVQRWKAQPGPAVLVATYDTLGTGHTLTKANHVVFHDLDMVPARMLQAEARVYRIGATRPVQSWWMTAEGTLDPFIFGLINRKAPVTAVFGDMGASDLDSFLDDGVDQDVEDILAWARRNAT